jgi:hypothetical protein
LQLIFIYNLKNVSRGQVPITKADFLAIPEVVTNPDKVRGIGKDKLGRETMVTL